VADRGEGVVDEGDPDRKFKAHGAHPQCSNAFFGIIAEDKDLAIYLVDDLHFQVTIA
jgi:hypothetical protein